MFFCAIVDILSSQVPLVVDYRFRARHLVVYPHSRNIPPILSYR